MHLYRLEKGKARLTEKMATKLAKALDVSSELLLQQPVPGAPVIGAVQAGVWREAAEDPLHIEGWDDPLASDYERIPCPPDRRYPHAPVFALRVEGDSMDKIFPPGSYALCVRLDDAALSAKDVPAGSIVVVQRRKHDIYEATLKRLQRTDGDIILVPESSNPRHKAIKLNPPQHPQDTETSITALVIGKYERM